MATLAYRSDCGFDPSCNNYESKPACCWLPNYMKLNKIGKGGYGVVYRAFDTTTSEIVAVKVLKESCRRTKSEITNLYTLPPHPNIVRFKNCFSNGDRVFMVMEYMEMDLASFLYKLKDSWSCLTLPQVKGLMTQILRGVDHLHSHGVMHRDLKPRNILVSETGRVKICDFGLSKVMDHGSCTPGVGTPPYKAREILMGSPYYTEAVDMWSVGCIMAELLSMKVLFQGKSEIDLMKSISGVMVEGKPSRKLLRKKLGGAGPMLSSAGFDLLEGLLAQNECLRITAKDAISHAWFKEYS